MLYQAVGAVGQDEYWGVSTFPAVDSVGVEAYEGAVILRGFSGVEGYDLKIEFDEDENVTMIVPIRNGKEQTAITSAGYIYTGLDDVNAMYVYVGYDLAYAAAYEDGSGYVLLCGYVYNKPEQTSDYNYYYCYWPADEEGEAPKGYLYSSVGEVGETEGWGESLFPAIRDIDIDVFESYFIINAFAGVEGYDLEVGFGENDVITYVTPIVDGEELDTYDGGFITLATGREDIPEITAYVGQGYSYAGIYEEESGYLIMPIYIGDEYAYYYCAWPQDEDGPGEWENPFEGEAEFLYSTVGETAVDEEWGETCFPEVKKINVDVYDNYFYVKNFAGVEGYGFKVAYTEDEDVLSIMPVVDGEDGQASKEYCYLATGRDDVTYIQPYCDYSYAYADEEGGYAMLMAYIYFEDQSMEWSYYYLPFDYDSSSIVAIGGEADKADYYTISGVKVDRPAEAGVYVRLSNGKAHKIIIK